MNTCLDNTYDALAWGSHLPALLACVQSSCHSDPVLELGVGHFSTPVLHALCGATGRHLISVEENDHWFGLFAERFERCNHRFIKNGYAEALGRLFDERSWSGVAFGAVLIDNSPGGERRALDFTACLPRCRYVVVHDYHRENEEMIKPHLGDCMWHVTRTYEPPTLVASSTARLPSSILCL